MNVSMLKHVIWKDKRNRKKFKSAFKNIQSMYKKIKGLLALGMKL